MIHETCAIRTCGTFCVRLLPNSAGGSPPLNSEHLRRIVCDERLDAEIRGAINPSWIVHCPDNDWQLPVACFLKELRSREKAMRQ